MEHVVRLERVAEQLTAVVRKQVNSETIGAQVGQVLAAGACYKHLNAIGVGDLGFNVFLYRDEQDRCLLNSATGLVLEIGVQVNRRFSGSDEVLLSSTPGGLVARTTHIGAYDGLSAAHQAVRSWCRENHRAIAGPNWEIYGDWSDDPGQCHTDVVYLLA